MGIIERWGMGTLNIIVWCSENANPPTVWSQQAGSVFVTFKSAALSGDQQRIPEVTGEVRRLLSALNGEMKRTEIQVALGLKH